MKIISKFKHWLLLRKQIAYKKQMENGFNHAAPILLERGDEGAKMLLQQIDSETDFGQYGAFEDGVKYAISCYDNIKGDSLC